MDEGERTHVGVDGGASTVRAWVVEAPAAPGRGWRVRGAALERALRDAHGAPLPGDDWVERSAACLAELARREGSRALAVGVCMPGRKSADGRGVLQALHLPPLPDFLDRLEARATQLAPADWRFAPRLSSDGDCLALGEASAAGGALLGVAHAWVFGGGTGLSEAGWSDGRVLSRSALEGRLEPVWSARCRAGATFEEALSARAWNERAGGPVEERLEQPAARAVLVDAVCALAELAERRREEARALLGVELERVVLAQRSARILADPRAAFARELLSLELARRGLAAPGFVMLSTLREAVAIGAALSGGPGPASSAHAESGLETGTGTGDRARGARRGPA